MVCGFLNCSGLINCFLELLKIITLLKSFRVAGYSISVPPWRYYILRLEIIFQKLQKTSSYFLPQNSALIFVFFFSFIILIQSPSFAAQNSDTEFADDAPNFYLDDSRFDHDNVLVLQVNISNTLVLDDTIVGYNEGKKIFLSLKDYVRILEFPVIFQNNNMLASGWFLDKKNTFFLDLDNNKCLIRNRKYTLSQSDLVIFNNDVFVNAKTLKKWFGFDVSYNENDQSILINSGGVLAVEKQYERDKEWTKLGEEKEYSKEDKLAQIEEDKLEPIKNSYKLVSFPFGDVTYGYSKSRSDGASNETTQLNALLAGDFLYLNNQLFATIQDNEVATVRLTAGRKDPEGKLLGPIGATEFSLGDVFTPEIPLAARSQAGKGATITNYPLEYVSQFNKVLVRGNAQVGWDVELFRNGSLLDFKKVSSQGIYEFVDVPLIAGLNIIKLVFHGPFGQQYEEIRRYSTGGDLLDKGKLYYRFAANKNNQDLIEGQTKKNATPNNSDGLNRGFAELGYGLTDNTSIVANFLKAPVATTATESSDFGGLSLRTSIGGVVIRLDNVRNLEDKKDAQELSLQTTFFDDYSLSSVFDRYSKEYVSESNPVNSDPLLNKINIRLDGPLKIPFSSFPARISVTEIQENYNSGNSRNDLETEVSLGLTRKLGITENIKYVNDQRITTEDKNKITGRTLLSYLYSDSLSFRGTISYNIQPSTELSSADVTSSYNFGDQYNWSFSVSHQFANNTQSDATRYTSNLTKTFEKFMLSLGLNYQDNDNYGMNVNLSTSFGYDTKNNIGVVSGIPLANSGAVAAKVFLDDNNNGVYDEGEDPLSGVEVIANSGRKIKTDEHGVALITNINATGVTKVSVNSDSLPDPFLLVRVKTIKIISHSGTINNIYFPVSRVGEISGYVVNEKTPGTINPASNVEFELIDKNNDKVFQTVKSGYDGYYIFEMIPFGKYQVRVSPDQERRIGFAATPGVNIELNKKRESIDDTNFVIRYGEFAASEKEYDTGQVNKIVDKVKQYKFGGVTYPAKSNEKSTDEDVNNTKVKGVVVEKLKVLPKTKRGDTAEFAIDYSDDDFKSSSQVEFENKIKKSESQSFYNDSDEYMENQAKNFKTNVNFKVDIKTQKVEDVTEFKVDKELSSPDKLLKNSKTESKKSVTFDTQIKAKKFNVNTIKKLDSKDLKDSKQEIKKLQDEEKNDSDDAQEKVTDADTAINNEVEELENPTPTTKKFKFRTYQESQETTN